MAVGGGEAAEQRAVDGGVKLADDVALDAEPAGGGVGAAAVEPLGGFEPVAERAGIRVEPEVLQHEGERAGRRRVVGELVVVEIVERGLVAVPHIHHGDRGIGQVGLDRLAARDGDRGGGEEHAAGEKFILMGAARVREDRGERRHSRPTSAHPPGKSHAADARASRNRSF
jgi:hypothetical protein